MKPWAFIFIQNPPPPATAYENIRDYEISTLMVDVMQQQIGARIYSFQSCNLNV
jgi:hypothetical protein